jgi:hypothetical protein
LARREALGKGIGALFSEPETDGKAQETPVITDESGVVSKESDLTKESSGVISKEPGIVSNEELVITDESEVISNKPEVTTKESELTSKDSGVISSESSVITNESEVVSRKQGVITDESRVVSKESKVIAPGEIEKEETASESRGVKSRQRSPAVRINQAMKQIDQEILEQAVEEAMKSPRISTWSPLVMSALRYLQLTTARFSMSKEVSETLEAAFKDKYPDLFEMIEKEIARK